MYEMPAAMAFWHSILYMLPSAIQLANLGTLHLNSQKLGPLVREPGRQKGQFPPPPTFRRHINNDLTRDVFIKSFDVCLKIFPTHAHLQNLQLLIFLQTMQYIAKLAAAKFVATYILTLHPWSDVLWFQGADPVGLMNIDEHLMCKMNSGYGW